MDLISPDLLRTFLAFAETGSLARAASVVHRTPSAVTAQMQRLEELAGRPLLAPAGRGRALTEAGEAMVLHARRVLAAHRDLWLSMQGAEAEGRVALGVTQDFSQDLPDLLSAFARSHPLVRLDLRVGRSASLWQSFREGALDVVLAMRLAVEAGDETTFREQMVWLGADGLRYSGDVPLALLDAPCGFREQALRALDMAGLGHRIVATSASLSGLQPAVAAGLAVTVRTRRWTGTGLSLAPAGLGLPPLPLAEFALRCRDDALPPARTLARLMAEGLRREG